MEAATLTPLARGRRALAGDERLVAATRMGDDQAFETLYHRYHRRIGAYVLGMVKDHQRAEDVTQEVFLSALRRIRATDRQIVFKPWLYEIAKNACIDQFRRTRRATEVSFDAEGDDAGVAPLVSSGPEPDEAAESRRQLDDLCGAFGALSDSHHQILVLRELEGRSYQEIGERLQMTRPAVESTLFRARKRLTEEYDELVSGERCRRVQGVIAQAPERGVGARDRRMMARHVSHCQPCRRVALEAGLEEIFTARPRVRGKIAALLPLPAFLRHSHGGRGNGRIAGWVHAAAPMADNASGWAKAATVAVTVALAGVGAGVATQHGGDGKPAQTSASLAGQAGAAARQASLPGGAGAAASATGVTSTTKPRTGKRAAADRSASRTRRAAIAPAGAGTGNRGAAVTGARTAGPITQPAPKSTNGSGASADQAATTTSSAGSKSTKTAPAAATTTSGASAPTTPASAGATVNQTVQGATQTVDGTVQGVDQAVQGVNQAVDQTVQAVGSTVTSATAGTPVGDTAAQVSTALNQTTQGVTGTVGQVVQTTQGAVSGVTSTLNGAVTGLGNPPAGG